jgi:hypothetical protein
MDFQFASQKMKYFAVAAKWFRFKTIHGEDNGNGKLISFSII